MADGVDVQQLVDEICDEAFLGRQKRWRALELARVIVCSASARSYFLSYGLERALVRRGLLTSPDNPFGQRSLNRSNEVALLLEIWAYLVVG